ncbi:MAG TPA: NAD(P)/FAD-dependent oxidoreductase [Blastocatellia bacterium]|nr:NAD(P)/FAD-dependent oxidoreductase [Blastocatellia bacterium]
MYEVIIVGARCAGAPTAMLLARRGYRVLLVDRAEFPSDIPHGHFIHRHGPRRLQEWGLLDRIVSSGCPPVTTMTSDYGGIALTGTELMVDGVALGYGPRRSALDKILVDAAVEAGAELRIGFTVEDFMTDDGRITGIRGRDRRNGAIVEEQAAVVVGADGRNSRLAQAVQAPMYEEIPAVTCWFFSYWSGVAHRGLEISIRHERVIFAFPTNDGLFGVFIAWPSSDLPMVRADIEGQFMAVVDQVPDLAERLRNGRREDRFWGATDLPNFLRKPYGDGWALVGDAGCHKDPFLALGCCDAFRDAEWLVEALDEGLSGRRPLPESMALYERRRNEATLPDYRQNLHLAQFKPLPDDQYRLLSALRGNQEAINQFYLAREGMIPAESFFNPENIGRILSAAPKI